MGSPYSPGMAPIQQLPPELKGLICEFAGFEAHRTRDYHVSRPDETCSQNDAYTWTPHSLMPDKVRTNTQVYDDLRSLALVSRDFAAPAQRALFTIVAIPKPISYFRVLRTLLLNPERGRLIRCLIPLVPHTFDNYLLREPIERAVWKEFIEMFTPTFCEEIEMLNLTNGYLPPANITRSRLVISWNPHPTALKRSLDTEAHNHMKPRQILTRLVAEALEDIIRLCPRLRAFHLLCSQAPPNFSPFTSPASWPLRLPIGQTLFNSNPLLTTLTVDFRALTGDLSPLRFTRPLPLCLQRGHLLPATITHLSLILHPSFHFWHLAQMSLFALGTWLSENHGLRSLRILNGLGHTTDVFGTDEFGSKTWNWNTILLKYKHSLEELEIDGRGLLLGQPFSALKLLGLGSLGSDFGILNFLFGEAKVLSCLGQMERLKVIKVPLHYLRRVRVPESGWVSRDTMLSMFEVPGVDIVEVIAEVMQPVVMEQVVRREQAIQVDVEFPVGAERIEVVVPGKLLRRFGFPPGELIIGVRTVVVRGEDAGVFGPW